MTTLHATTTATPEAPAKPAEVAAAPPEKPPSKKKRKRRFIDRIESFISRMNMRSTLMHRLSSMIWLPYAFRSGIKMKRVDEETFTAELPFRRFNKNWYNAMAGAALLGNSEIAGGMYIHGRCGGDYTVVCKHLEYKFLRPCFGPALYKIRPHEDLDEQIASGAEFNTTLTLDIVQGLRKPGDKEKRVGRATATFHITPKDQYRKRKKKGKKQKPERSGSFMPTGPAVRATDGSGVRPAEELATPDTSKAEDPAA